MSTCCSRCSGPSTANEPADLADYGTEISLQTSHRSDLGDQDDQSEYFSDRSGYMTATELSEVEKYGLDDHGVPEGQSKGTLESEIYYNLPKLGGSPDGESEMEVYGRPISEFELLFVENRETFESLKKDPKFKDLFSFNFPDMKLGKKIAEGGQAEIYEGIFTMGDQKEFPCVVKAFREGFVVSELQRQWPQGILKGGNSEFPGFFSGTSSILGGLLLKDGRFAFVLRREWGDLRQLIDLRMKKYDDDDDDDDDDDFWNHKPRMYKGPVFSDQCAKKMMLEIAMSMRQLHNHGILHRDLKSANVFVCTPDAVFPKDIKDDAFNVKVFDFEYSFGNLGTRFWRAPEILQTIKERTCRVDIFTKEADIYSYGMTCYEILTGCIPFGDRLGNDYDLVLNGKRPELPHYIDDWLRDLIRECWQLDPRKRPGFEDIVKVFQANFSISQNPIHIVQEQIAAS